MFTSLSKKIVNTHLKPARDEGDETMKRYMHGMAAPPKKNEGIVVGKSGHEEAKTAR